MSMYIIYSLLLVNDIIRNLYGGIEIVLKTEGSIFSTIVLSAVIFFNFNNFANSF